MTSSGDDRLDERLAREAAAALPPERDDEPASLRQDILDELGDHLACAFRRELLRTNGDAARAETNVRQRFGNPSQVARRLWFDAMKGKLMAQKILIGTCAVVVAACVLFGVLLWRTAVEAREANAAMLSQMQDANAALLEQSQTADAALLKQIKSLRQSAAVNDPEWNSVKVRLVSGSPDGPPASGMRISLSSQGETPGAGGDEVSGTDGAVDFGLRQPGEYRLTVQTPWNERMQRIVQVYAGRALNETVVCPAEPLPTVPIDWSASWPEAFLTHPDRDELWCVVAVEGVTSRAIAGQTWTTETDRKRRLLAFHPDGRMIDLLAVDPPAWWDHPETALVFDDARSSAVDQRRQILNGLAILRANLNAARRDRLPVAQVRSSERLRVTAVALARWNGEGSPLTMLVGLKSMIEYENGMISTALSPFMITLRVDSTTDVTMMTPPPTELAGSVIWTIPVPAELPETTYWDVPTVFGESDLSFRTDVAGRRLPVEAPRPKPLSQAGTFEVELTPVRVECVTGSKSGPPLAGVVVQLDRAGFPNDPWSFFNLKTNEEGSVLFQMPPGSYHNHLTMPWGEHSHDRNVFEVAAWESQSRSGTRVETFVCPAGPPPTAPVTLDVRWPAVAKQRSDLWLVLELAGAATRSVGDRQWRDTDWRLVAIHPDGRIVAWKENSAKPYIGWHRVDRLPAMLSKLVPDDDSIQLLRDAKMNALGFGIARWNGEGDPSGLLRGLRDGRYVSHTRGAFFYVLRKLVPMKADDSLPAVTRQEDAGQPRLGFAVPEPFLLSALSRWDGVPQAAAK